MNSPGSQPPRPVSDKGHHEALHAYVLHTYAFRETSLIVEAFSREHGRVGLVAKGARRPKSSLRGLLLGFQPLLLSWSGKAELRTLTRAEWQGSQPPIVGLALICGFYLNELLIRLLPRDDPHERLFDHYRTTLEDLGGEKDLAVVLRKFEVRLLQELGYALALERSAEDDTAIIPARLYSYVPERGPLPAGVHGLGDSTVELRGKTLLDMAREDYSDPVTRAEGKALMRLIINHHLGGKPLHTRQLLKDLREL
jgi:DNA repair protein RecO (recombination protein O)